MGIARGIVDNWIFVCFTIRSHVSLYLRNIVTCWVILSQVCGWNWYLSRILIRLQKLDGARRLLRLFSPTFERSIARVQMLIYIGHVYWLVPLEFLNHTCIIKKRWYLYRIRISSIIYSLWSLCSYLLSTLYAVGSLVLILCNNSAWFRSL